MVELNGATGGSVTITGDLPAALPGMAPRVLGSTDLGARLIPRGCSYGVAGTCAGISAVLDEERNRQPTVWRTRAGCDGPWHHTRAPA